MNGKKFSPKTNKIYVFDQHSILVFNSGYGLFQVDFRNYLFSSGKAIFLSPGQYFQQLSGSMDIDIIQLPDDEVGQTENARFLFKHLISLGHINLSRPKNFHLDQLQYLKAVDGNTSLLISAINQWMEQNPFNASNNEVNLLFDLKDIIDARYREPIPVTEVSKALKEKEYHIKSITREKLGSTVHRLRSKKLLLEAKRQVIFTDRGTQEIAYDLGFKHSTYFSRFFKLCTQQTPYEFRNDHTVEKKDTFLEDLTELIDKNFKQHHQVTFYSEKLHLTPKSLMKKVKSKSNKTVSQLINERILHEAKIMLHQELPIYSIAYELGFKEPNHFSSFFKLHTGQSPSTYKTAQYES